MSEKQILRILLIEDEADDYSHLMDILGQIRSFQLQTSRATTLAEAEESLSASPLPDLIITDLTLPDSNGLDTFRSVYAKALTVPIIVLTGMDSESLALEAMEEGAQDYLSKRNVDVDMLRRSIRYAIARHRSEKALRESEERFALAVLGSNNGMWDWNLITNEMYYSPRWKSIIGYQDYELEPHPKEWLDRIHPEDKDLVSEKLHAHVDDLTSHFQAEYRMAHRGGGYIWVLTRGLAVRDEDGNSTRVAGSHEDVTSRKKAEEQLIYNAFHDSLTGLPNRALLHDRLDRSIRRMKRNSKYSFAVMFLDLDRFKVINDSKGHEYGDRVLVEFSRRLSTSVRPGDTVARLGGDEFVILGEDIHSADEAFHMAQRLHEAFAGPLYIGGESHYLTVSIGITLSSPNYQLPEQLIRDADTAMYRAKAKGRSTSEVFDKEMHDTAVAILELENDLRRAVEENQFEVYYQPIINLKTGRIRGVEALARWQHPRSGLLPPINFIPLAEETGLINRIGWLVLKEACQQMAAWHQQFPADDPLTVSVNLSSRQLSDPTLVERVVNVLDETHLNPKTLILEITESTLITDYENNADVIKQLREIGVRIHIDDFGVGYSSLSHLRHFITDNLKIDRSFVMNMMDEAENSEIVRTIVTLARTLGMNSTAEGLETADQVMHARQLECEDGQGFFFSEPRSGEEIGLLLANNPIW